MHELGKRLELAIALILGCWALFHRKERRLSTDWKRESSTKSSNDEACACGPTSVATAVRKPISARWTCSPTIIEVARASSSPKVRAALNFYQKAVERGAGAWTAPLRVVLLKSILDIGNK